MASEHKIFLTGATGIVGRAMLQRLAGDKRAAGRNMPQVFALSRNVSAFPEAGVRALMGRIGEPQSYARELEGCTEVIHLAAMTGKGRPDDFQRANVDATRALVEECRRRGVRRFLYCSSVAANYPELEHYPYRRSKREAEQVVRESGLDWTIVRPTIVLSRRAKIWHSLSGMAGLPVVPLFGDGRVKIQPILADDLGECLTTWIEDPSFDRGEYDLGGPEVLEFRDFLGRIHTRKRGGRPRLLPLPAKLAIGVLAPLERVLLPVLPMTAGQLYAFVYDSTAKPNALAQRHAASMRGVEKMLDELLKYD